MPMELEDFAKRVRQACVDAAVQAYEDAGIHGLCTEGRWEAAVSALRTVELARPLRELEHCARPSRPRARGAACAHLRHAALPPADERAGRRNRRRYRELLRGGLMEHYVTLFDSMFLPLPDTGLGEL